MYLVLTLSLGSSALPSVNLLMASLVLRSTLLCALLCSLAIVWTCTCPIGIGWRKALGQSLFMSQVSGTQPAVVRLFSITAEPSAAVFAGAEMLAM